MQQREIAPVSSRVQRRSRLGDVLAEDCRVADLLVAVPQFVVREANRFLIVGLLGMTQCPAEECDRARLIAFGKCDAAVKPPQRREECGRKVVARRVGWPAKRGSSLRDIVCHQPGLGERAAKTDFVFVFEARRLQRQREDADRVGMTAALQCRSRARQRRLKGDGDHGPEYTTARPEPRRR